jgi:phenylacetate-coenzyme A ligase PaaK-like adenylate-forming protein
MPAWATYQDPISKSKNKKILWEKLNSIPFYRKIQKKKTYTLRYFVVLKNKVHTCNSSTGG